MARSTYFHAEDSPYIRAIGPRYLISAVARIYRPGCKVDHMLVLEGPQGKQKSEALRTLAVNDAWFTDRLSHVASKDAAQETRWRTDHRDCGDGRADPGDAVRDEIVPDPPPRSVSPALRQAPDNPSRGSACSPAPSTRPRRAICGTRPGRGGSGRSPVAA